MKAIFYLAFIFCAFLILHLLIEWNGMRVWRKNILEMELEGQIQKKSIDYERRSAPYVVVDGWRHDIYDAKLFDLMLVGDTLIKHRGSLTFQLIRNGDTEELYEYYRDEKIE